MPGGDGCRYSMLVADARKSSKLIAFFLNTFTLGVISLGRSSRGVVRRTNKKAHLTKANKLTYHKPSHQY